MTRVDYTADILYKDTHQMKHKLLSISLFRRFLLIYYATLLYYFLVISTCIF